MKPHVTLVNPPYPMGAHQHPPFTPLGLGYLAAVLEKNHYKVDVIDWKENLRYERYYSGMKYTLNFGTGFTLIRKII